MKVHATPTKTPIDPQHPIDPQEWEIEYEKEDLQFLLDDQQAENDLRTRATKAVHAQTAPMSDGTHFFSDDGFDYDSSHAEMWAAVIALDPNWGEVEPLLEWLNSGGSYNKWVLEDQPPYRHSDPTKEMMVEVCKSTNPSVQWQALPTSVKNDWICRPSS